MTKKLFTLLLVITISAIGAMAQNAIRWRTTVKMTSPTEGVLTVKAIIAEGWHLYSTDLPQGGPVPTTFDFKKSHGLTFTSPFKASAKVVSKNDETFGMTLNWWENNVTFTRTFRLTGAAEQAEILGSIRYMACNDATCLPPKTENVRLQIKPYAAPAKKK